MPDAYTLINVRQEHGAATVLDIPELRIPERGILGIAGPNGSGKTTLLRILALLDQPRAGQILFKNKPAQDYHPTQLRRRITLLSQEPYLLRRSVAHNVAYGLKIRGKSDDAAVRQALKLVGLDPGTFATRHWHELSGGEAQRVALAARLVLEPEVLLMDEPTASLDEESAALIKDAALSARQRLGATLVIVSHDRPWLDSVCDGVVELRRGRVSEG